MNQEGNPNPVALPIVTVLGGGIAGLTAAHELVERGFDVQVVESQASDTTEYQCDVGGLAANQFARVRAPLALLHPDLLKPGQKTVLEGATKFREQIRTESTSQRYPILRAIRFDKWTHYPPEASGSAKKPQEFDQAPPTRREPIVSIPQDWQVYWDEYGTYSNLKLDEILETIRVASQDYMRLYFPALAKSLALGTDPDANWLDGKFLPVGIAPDAESARSFAAREILLVQIIGYTDTDGTLDENRSIANAWANWVRKELIDRNNARPPDLQIWHLDDMLVTVPQGCGRAIGRLNVCAAGSGSSAENAMLPVYTEEVAAGGILVPAEGATWNAEKIYRLGRVRTTIGRSALCNVRVNNPSVSRVHAELTWSNGMLHLTHLSTAAPTLVNGLPLTNSAVLVTGDLIQIGDGVTLRVELFAPDDAPTAPRRIDKPRMYAVLHADVSGYSKLVEADAAGVSRRLEQCFELIRRHTSRSGDRIETHGDSLLCLHTSALVAVETALAWQSEIAALNGSLPERQRLMFRVGIHSGDILISGSGNPHGEGINVAARIQAMAPPGGIFVTGTVRDHLMTRDDMRFVLVGDETLRNVSYGIRVFRLDAV